MSPSHCRCPIIVVIIVVIVNVIDVTVVVAAAIAVHVTFVGVAIIAAILIVGVAAAAASPKTTALSLSLSPFSSSHCCRRHRPDRRHRRCLRRHRPLGRRRCDHHCRHCRRRRHWRPRGKGFPPLPLPMRRTRREAIRTSRGDNRTARRTREDPLPDTPGLPRLLLLTLPGIGSSGNPRAACCGPLPSLPPSRTLLLCQHHACCTTWWSIQGIQPK